MGNPFMWVLIAQKGVRVQKATSTTWQSTKVSERLREYCLLARSSCWRGFHATPESERERERERNMHFRVYTIVMNLTNENTTQEEIDR